MLPVTLRTSGPATVDTVSCPATGDLVAVTLAATSGFAVVSSDPSLTTTVVSASTAVPIIGATLIGANQYVTVRIPVTVGEKLYVNSSAATQLTLFFEPEVVSVNLV